MQGILLPQICSFVQEVPGTISHQLKTDYIYTSIYKIGAGDIQNYKSVCLYSPQANILPMSRHLGGSSGQRLSKPGE